MPVIGDHELGRVEFERYRMLGQHHHATGDAVVATHIATGKYASCDDYRGKNAFGKNKRRAIERLRRILDDGR